MQSKRVEPYAMELQDWELFSAKQNRNALVTILIGLGSILSLLLTCYLVRYQDIGSKTKPLLILLAVMLAASLGMLYILSRWDDRWFLVCCIINHSGIGLAAALLLYLLKLHASLKILILSGFPAAALLIGIVLFFISAGADNRKKLLYGGMAVFVALFVISVILFFQEKTAFWLTSALSAILGGTSIWSLAWSNNYSYGNSLYKGMAVSSFLIYAVLLALLTLVSSILGGKSKNRKNDVSILALLRNTSVDDVKSGFEDMMINLPFHAVHRQKNGVCPAYLWFYTPSTHYAAIDRLVNLNEAEKEALRSRYRNRRRAALSFVVLAVAVVIGFAVYFSRI